MMRFRWLRKITGISFPFFGVSWNPDPDEREILYELLQKIGNHRAITGEHHCHPLSFDSYHYGTLYEIKVPALLNTLDKVRLDTSTALSKLDPESEFRSSLEYIRRLILEFYRYIEELDVSSKGKTHVNVPEHIMLQWRKFLFCMGTELMEINDSLQLGFGGSYRDGFSYMFYQIQSISSEEGEREKTWYMTSRREEQTDNEEKLPNK